MVYGKEIAIKIGVTEAGDAGLDMSWRDCLSSVDGSILVTKRLSDEFIDAVTKLGNVIVHATCTGYGGTVLEPNVPPAEWTLGQLRKLLNVFDRERTVLRVDPIIPTKKGMETFARVVESSGFVSAGNACGTERVRISVLDMYPHVRRRFVAAGLPLPYGDSFTASEEQFAELGRFIGDRFPYRIFEACAEPKLKSPYIKRTGCVSGNDLQLMGIKQDRACSVGYQRKGCLCLNCKTELLGNKTRCGHRCLYCYWRDDAEK
jgi:DNA repair photolyase